MIDDVKSQIAISKAPLRAEEVIAKCDNLPGLARLRSQIVTLKTGRGSNLEVANCDLKITGVRGRSSRLDRVYLWGISINN